MDDTPAPRYIVQCSDDCDRVKYWTGHMLGPWPEYLGVRRLAYPVSKVAARVIASRFNSLFDHLRWSVKLA